MGKGLLVLSLIIAFSFQTNGRHIYYQQESAHPIFADQEQAISEDMLMVYIDQSNEKEFDYVQSMPDNFFEAFKDLEGMVPDVTYWIKFRLRNTTRDKLSFILFTGTNTHETIYFIRKGRVSERKAGYLTPASEREIPLGYRSKARLDIESGEEMIVLVRAISKDNFSPRFNFNLVPYSDWSKSVDSRNIFEGVFTGFLVILSLLGLIFFGYTREREFLYFGLYCLSNCIYFLNYYGYLDLYLFPDNPQWLMPFWIMTTLTAVFYFAFTRSFIETEKLFPRWHRFFGYVMKVLFILFLTNLTYLLVTQDTKSAVIFHNLLVIGIGLLVLIFIASVFTKNHMVVRYYSLGTVFLIITAIISSYSYLIDLDSNIPYIAQAGILIEIVIFSLGMGHKIKRDFDNHNITQESLILQLTENERLQLSINQELEEKVAARTHQLNEQKLQLQKARNTAELATKAKTEFLSVMSHEIRTPLNAIISLSHLMEIENENEETQEYIDALKFSAESLHSLINDILDYNKIEAGKLKLESTDFSLIDLLKNICESFKFKASSKGIRLILEVGDLTPDRIIGDPTRLTQVFNNLISNALKFTHEGNVTIGTELRGIKDDKATLNFWVADTGIGIPKEKLREIFEDYEQASRETTRKYGGTGLGLAITKKLVELHGSDIGVHSVEGEGTRFDFSIDFKMYDSEQIFDISEEPADSKGLNQAKVLVVDDNDMNRLVLKRLFNIWKAECIEANSGKEALAKADTIEFDLILMDLQMDELDGFETADMIRESSKLNQQTRILAMTAQRASGIHDKVSKSHMIEIISKPFEPQELYQKLRQYLVNERSA